MLNKRIRGVRFKDGAHQVSASFPPSLTHTHTHTHTCVRPQHSRVNLIGRACTSRVALFHGVTTRLSERHQVHVLSFLFR